MGGAIAEQLQDQAAQIIRLRDEIAAQRTEAQSARRVASSLIAELAEAMAVIDVTDDTIQRVHTELAEARRALLASNDTVLANKKLQERIAELDAHMANEYARCEAWKARAERAEAAAACYTRQVGSADAENANLRDAVKRAEAELKVPFEMYARVLDRTVKAEAELRTMREALELVDADVRHHLRSDAIDHALLRKHAVAAVRAALAPSPAGREG